MTPPPHLQKTHVIARPLAAVAISPKVGTALPDGLSFAILRTPKKTHVIARSEATWQSPPKGSSVPRRDGHWPSA